jgi:hypothetical protein
MLKRIDNKLHIIFFSSNNLNTRLSTFFIKYLIVKKMFLCKIKGIEN